MVAVWRSVKEFDIDKNGFMQCSELEDCFREHFPAELEGKSLVYLFRKFSASHDKHMINYRKLKA
jgi:Ca2+-binding EF-hand superfamily protein